MLRSLCVPVHALVVPLVAAALTGTGVALAEVAGCEVVGGHQLALLEGELRRSEPAPAGRDALTTPRTDRKMLLVPEPVFIVAGLRAWVSGQWSPVPAELPTGVPVEFAVEVRNVGTTGGTAVLTAVAEVWPLDKSPLVHVMSGAATVVLAPGAAYFLQLGPAWLPLSAGSYRILGSVAESGVEIGDFTETVQVFEGTEDCVVPAVDLP